MTHVTIEQLKYWILYYKMRKQCTLYEQLFYIKKTNLSRKKWNWILTLNKIKRLHDKGKKYEFLCVNKIDQR